NDKNLINLLEYTINRNGTELHICPGAVPFIRINGKLKEISVSPFTTAEAKSITDKIIDVDQKHVLLKSRTTNLTFSINDVGRFRAYIYSQRGTFATTIRVLPFGIPAFDDLGLPEILKSLVEKQKGILIVTGMARSGKTTTLAALVDFLNENGSRHIATIENPIEYLHRHKKCIVSQQEIGADTPDFQTALRWVKKSGADVIVLSEMPRDADPASQEHTLRRILALAEEKLILASIRDIGEYVTRLHDTDRNSLSNVLEGVVYQHLTAEDGCEPKINCDVVIPDAQMRENIRTCAKTFYQIEKKLS
ncbi:MAG: Flp pilus assembly complex ATPase component TadA, partial [Clostridiales bacterium]|nr:Flp pilus assembly complex ATPase component TadA [Clostridiales bacterium]